MLNQGFGGTSERMYGTLELKKRTSNTWGAVYTSMSSNFSGGLCGGCGDAYAGGTLDRIQLAVNTGSFSTGFYTINVYTE